MKKALDQEAGHRQRHAFVPNKGPLHAVQSLQQPYMHLQKNDACLRQECDDAMWQSLQEVVQSLPAVAEQQAVEPGMLHNLQASSM
jgi:hypothetical protein